jgi:hypothetical protein
MSECEVLFGGGEPSCLANPKVYLKIDCRSCSWFEACTRGVTRRHPDLLLQRERDAAFQATVSDAKERVRRVKEAAREDRALLAEKRASLRPPADVRPAMSEAERKRAWRDARQQAKADAFPELDYEVLERGRAMRRDLLVKALQARPLPHDLRHLVGREEELAAAWLARELAKVPYRERANGRPTTVKSAAWCFDILHGSPNGETSADSMARKLKVVEKLEATVWLDADAVDASLPSG